MDYQTAFNIVFALSGFLGGWVLNGLRDSLKSLQAADESLTEKVQAIEVLVAGQYVKREDFSAVSKAMFEKLDKIYDKLDTKADK
jgi:CHASE3 domain sensor protein